MQFFIEEPHFTSGACQANFEPVSESYKFSERIFHLSQTYQVFCF